MVLTRCSAARGRAHRRRRGRAVQRGGLGASALSRAKALPRPFLLPCPACPHSAGGAGPGGMAAEVKVTGQSQEQLLLLARSARGAALVSLIHQVLEAPGIYVFGELLDLPNVREVSAGPAGSAGAVLHGLARAWCAALREEGPQGSSGAGGAGSGRFLPAQHNCEPLVGQNPWCYPGKLQLSLLP